MIDIGLGIQIGPGINIGDFPVFLSNFVTQDDINLVSQTDSQFVTEE
jgi:hypothetical protein